MNHSSSRQSWDTSIKHLIRHGLLTDVLTARQIATIPSSNISRWKQESDEKYRFCEINQIIKEEVELIKRVNQSSNIKKINLSYFKLLDTFHKVISEIKEVKTKIKEQKEVIVNTVEDVKQIIPINEALKVFDISRSTYENYKSILIHRCDFSSLKLCSKRFPNQLLPREVYVIKTYMMNENYRHWSKSSVYLKALRNGNLSCGISTFYKYCKLLGFKNRPRRKKSDDYNPVRTSHPNQIWCADVTIFKTTDNTKHYIHFLIDHYSKMILGYRIEKSSSGTAIRSLIQNSFYKNRPTNLKFLTDGGSENINVKVAHFINSPSIPIKHIIAQRDVVFSNSMIEAVNKIIKHQFLFPRNIENREQLRKAMAVIIPIYNSNRPQMSLGGNTPAETFNGVAIDLSRHTGDFKFQKQLRLEQNKKNECRVCC